MKMEMMMMMKRVENERRSLSKQSNAETSSFQLHSLQRSRSSRPKSLREAAWTRRKEKTIQRIGSDSLGSSNQRPEDERRSSFSQRESERGAKDLFLLLLLLLLRFSSRTTRQTTLPLPQKTFLRTLSLQLCADRRRGRLFSSFPPLLLLLSLASDEMDDER